MFPDADLEEAVAWSVFGITFHFGQVCHAGTRIYVHEDIYDKFLEAFTKKMSALKVGSNFDKSSDQGPQNSRMQLEKILSYIDIGKKEGATLALGGQAVQVAGGYYVQPTIFTNVQPQMKVSIAILRTI